MSIQGIKRTLTLLAHPTGEHMSQEHQWRCFTQLYQAYFQIANQVNAIQSSFQVFLASYGAVATFAVTMPIPTPSTSYGVFVTANQNNGAIYITAKSKTGFTLNFPTVAAGSAWCLVVLGD